MKSLPSLRKIFSLPNIGESEVSSRFTSDLIAEWGPLLSAMSRNYEIPGRLDAVDLRQELIMSIWRLTTRVDPYSRPEDFRRMCRAELRNKCIDLNRYAKARKRLGRTGRAVQCGACGSVSRVSMQALAECEFCNERLNLREVETYAKDYSIFSDKFTAQDTQEHVNIDHGNRTQADMLLESELLDRVRKKIPKSDHPVMELLLDPPAEFAEYMGSVGPMDRRQTITKYYARFLGLPEKDVAESVSRIKTATLKVCNRQTEDA